MEIEARYRLGKLVLLASQQHAEARKTWQDLLDGSDFRLAESDLLAERKFSSAGLTGFPNQPTMETSNSASPLWKPF